MKLEISLFEEDLLLACQHAYYCHGHSIVPDKAYDDMAAEFELLHHELPVGSDKPEDYHPRVRALSLYFMLSGRVVHPLHDTDTDTHPPKRTQPDHVAKTTRVGSRQHVPHDPRQPSRRDASRAADRPRGGSGDNRRHR